MTPLSIRLHLFQACLQEVDTQQVVRRLSYLQGSGTFIDPRYFDRDLDSSDRDGRCKFSSRAGTVFDTSKCQAFESLSATCKASPLLTDGAKESHVLTVLQNLS